MEKGGNVYNALATRRFEPDAPNWTPRISGILFPGGEYFLSILKADGNEDPGCERFYYAYSEPKAGEGRFISTYEGFGAPLPSFSGEPVRTAVPAMGARALAERIWASLDPDNKVSLYVMSGGTEVIINKNKED